MRRDEKQLTADMLLAVRRHNAATSQAEERTYRESLELDLAEMMRLLHLGLSPREDDVDKPNRLFRALVEVGADDVEAREVAQRHLDRLHGYLTRKLLEDESILNRNLAPLINAFYSDGTRSWDTLRNARNEVRKRGPRPVTVALDRQAAERGVPYTVTDVEDPGSSVADRVAHDDLEARRRSALTRVADELGPMHGLVFRLGYDPLDFNRFKIPPKAISRIVTSVLAGKCSAPAGLEGLVEHVNEGVAGVDVVSPATLKSATIVAKYWIGDHPGLRERSWKEANVRRIAREIDTALSAVLGTSISRIGAKKT
jgi:hypothetical protein